MQCCPSRQCNPRPSYRLKAELEGVRKIRPAISLVGWAAAAYYGMLVAGPVFAAGAPLGVGERLYRDGILPDGTLLRGNRDNGTPMTGAAAACTNCHRRSGLGSFEGTTVVPPIIGKYLFRGRQANVQDMSLPHIPGYVPNREAYTDESLAAAIRTGVAPGGRTLSYLMPRYALDDATLQDLDAYLKQLTTDSVPGVSETTLDFATIITPDADAVARQGMLNVLEHFVAGQNRIIAAEVRPMKASREIMYRVTRRWQLHVWNLTGAPGTWRRQLEAKLAANPVFAVISGLGAHSWQPVHEFCEAQAIPCLFPNVDLPVVAEQNFYPVYFNRGVFLEADLIAHGLPAGGRVLQVFGTDDIGAAAASALRESERAKGVQVVDHAFSGDARAAMHQVLSESHAGDRLVLWLRNADLRALPQHLHAGVEVYASGLMAGLENAAPPQDWRQHFHMAYPFDLPDARRVRMNFPLGWMRVQGIPVVDERVQSDTYLACQILSEALGHMLDSFVRDFLLERLEVMLSSRLVSAYYPRLGLAPGQRFASKGGYLVHFVASQGTAIAPDDGWTVP